MSITRQIAVLVALAAAVAALWFSGAPQRFLGAVDGAGSDAGGGTGNGSATPAADERPVVVVQPVSFTSDAARVESVGTAKAVRSVTLYAEATGIVQAVRFAADSLVQAGDVLLRLDDEEERLAVESARVRLREAERSLERMRRLSQAGSVSAARLDTARTEHELARIELARAELALRQRTLRAPFTGAIGIAQVDVGERVTPETAIASLDDRTALTVDFEVPEVFAPAVAVGDAIEATSWTRARALVRGTVTAMASRVDPQARTLLVRARVPNEADRFRPGMAFSVRFSLEGERFPAVPSLAVLWERNAAYVWRVVDGRVERLDVRVLKREEGWVLVDAPLARGERIVVEGVQALRPGLAVQVREQAPVAVQEGRDGD